MTTATLTSRASTAHVPVADRVAYWEEYNRRRLVGLTCRSYAEEGLLCEQSNFDLGAVRMAEIRGNAHVIERTGSDARSTPKESVFASLLLAGDAVFLNEAGCLSASAGDLVLYDTRRPYLFGFSASMRKRVLDIPRELFVEHCSPALSAGPMVFGRSAREGELVRLLGAVLSRVGPGATGTDDAVLQVLRQLLGERTGRFGVAGPEAQLRVAQEYVERHLADPDLCVDRVADAVGLSARQLSRIFATAEVSPARYIVEQRLTRAYADLTDPGQAGATIADIAYRWGFSSQGWFARQFRDRFEMTPSQARELTPAN